MKSIINETAPAPEIKFPCLMQSTDTPLIVMFTSTRQGLVVHDPREDSGRYPIGLYRQNWVNCQDRSEWKPFNGTVTLSNS